MMNYKALAWDDNPDEYLVGLKARFESHNHPVSLEYERERDDFWTRFENEQWDFVILDIVDASPAENPRRTAGIKLAERIRNVNKRIPIIFITGQASTIAEETSVTGPVVYRSKSLTYGDMILDILQFVKANAFDYTKVFLIYGHDRRAGNIRGSIKATLEGLGVTVVEISPETAQSLLADELLKRMFPCGAFVAICTPDDPVGENFFQPRQNVILEIGIVMGMSHGLERLVILQRWGNKPSEMARIPSDLEGKLGIRFTDENNYQDALDDMVKSLRGMGLRMKPESVNH